MPLVKKDYPLILFKGMNSDLLNGCINNNYDLILDNNIIRSLNTKELFNTFIINKYNNNISTNHILDSEYIFNESSLLETTKCNFGIKYGNSSGSNPLPLLTISNIPIPKVISISAEYNNKTSSLGYFGILFETNLKKYKLAEIWDPAADSSVGVNIYTDNRNVLNTIYEGLHKIDINLNIPIDTPHCFIENEKEGNLSISAFRMNSGNPSEYVYIKELKILF